MNQLPIPGSQSSTRTEAELAASAAVKAGSKRVDLSRPSYRRLGALVRNAALVAATMLAFASSPASAAQGVRYIDCRLLPGAGSYNDPKRVGAITQPTIVYDCPPLTAGRPFNVTYFAFALPRQPTPDAAILTFYAANSGGSGVHPRLAWGPQTTKGSLGAEYYNDGQSEGFYHSLNDVWAGDAWRVGAEKLSSPLGSVQTAWYHITFVP